MKHDPSLRCFHLIDTHGSVLLVVGGYLLSHSISHENWLVGVAVFGVCKSKYKQNVRTQKEKYLPHFLVVGRLTLGTSEVVDACVQKSVGKGTVGHGMLVSPTLFEVLHHIGKSGLCCGLSSFLLLNLLQILPGGRVCL